MSRQPNDKLFESHARRAAKRAGFIARKSRARPSGDNLEGFMLVDERTNTVQEGQRFDMTAEEVIDYCAEASRCGQTEI